MPTSSASRDRTKAVKAERFRRTVRAHKACPTCEAPAGYYCKSEETGGRREANHQARVEALVGYSLATVAWTNQAKRRKRHNGRNLQYVETS